MHEGQSPRDYSVLGLSGVAATPGDSNVQCSRALIWGGGGGGGAWGCLHFAVPDPFGTQGLKRTNFSWPSAWWMEDGVETQRKMGMLGGYTGSSVGGPDGFLNDWHGADLLCTETSQQFDWPAAWLVGYGGMLAALDSPSLCWHVSPASQLSLAVDKELLMPNLEDIGHRPDKSSCWLVLPLTSVSDYQKAGLKSSEIKFWCRGILLRSITDQ